MSTTLIFSQEALKSLEEEYYDFMALQGLVERPTLGYRTLSDSVWNFVSQTEMMENDDGTFTKVNIAGQDSEKNVWKNNNLGTTWTLWNATEDGKGTNWFTRGFYNGLKTKVYGPEWFNSYNTESPYGQNDGALWQGKGYNTSFTTGIRLEGLGFEFTFKPQISFTQNLPFDYIKPNYSGNNFYGKAESYGYYGVTSIDAPQRFGDKSFFTFDFGDTELRYTFYNFTFGFGTQAIWLGPAQINPIIHSNNAGSYPKIDVGLRKTKIYMPYFGWDLGDIEFRSWWGKLTESYWFDNDDKNNDTLISGLTIAYSFPWILRGFTVSINRNMLSNYEFNNYNLFNIFIPGIKNSTSGGTDNSDQRFSLTFDYLFKDLNLDLYFEWARNDYSPNLDWIIRYPFHTQGWTFGIIKNFKLKNNYLQFNIEITGLETSSDYDRLIPWYTSFYTHHIITKGYTNRGQILGAGSGTGSNSQYLSIKYLFEKGYILLFTQRHNPDLDYTMYIDSKINSTQAEKNIRCNLDFGIEANIFINKNFAFINNYTFEIEINPLNTTVSDGVSKKRYNNIFQLTFKYIF